MRFGRVWTVLAAPFAVVVAAAPAAASDAALLRVVDRLAPAVQAELPGALPADPSGTQRAYDRARDLMLALEAVGPTPGCAALAGAARGYALAAVRVPEAVDRLLAAGPARARAVSAYSAVRAAGTACAPRAGGGTGGAPRAPRTSPGPGEAFFGQVVADAPAGGADRAQVLLDGALAGEFRVRAGRARGVVTGAPGRRDLTVRFLRGERVVGVRRAAGVWLLPAGAAVAVPATRVDDGARFRLAGIGTSARPVVGLWVQDLAAGTAAGWNSRTPFPAASTVKLAVMVAALARHGSDPAASPVAYDVRQIGAWSSNLANNRLLAVLGGSESGGAAVAGRVLTRLGATASTFTGGYIVGTELQPALPGDPVRRPVPAVSRRVTTAADLARVLFAIHAAAAGDRTARSATGLSTRAARVLLGSLLASEQRGDNLSLLSGGVPAATPMAQKNGWIRVARHAAALIYTPDGPRIAVMLSHSAGGMGLPAARTLGSRVAEVAAR